MNHQLSLLPKCLMAAIAASAISVPNASHAQLVWDGGAGTPNWTDDANWVGDPVVDPTNTANTVTTSLTANQVVNVASPNFFQLTSLAAANDSGTNNWQIQGRLEFANNGTIQFSGARNVDLGNGTSNILIATGRTVTASRSGGTNDNHFIRNMTGAGTLVMNGGLINFASNNSFTGTIRVDSGTFQQADSWTATGAKLIMNGGTLRGRSAVNIGPNVAVEFQNDFRWDTANAVNIQGNVAITHATGVTIDLEGGTNPANLRTISGVISGVGKSLTFTDDDQTLTLSGTSPNTYTGGTILDNVGGGAKIIAAKDGAFGTGNVTVKGGAILTLQSGVTHNYIDDLASLLLNTGAFVNLNFLGSDTIAALSFDGGTTFASAGTWGATGSGAANINNTFFAGTGTLTVIPEPSAGLLILGGIAMITLLRRRRRF